ncbi:MAG: ParA family protein [Pseudomonadales bacterium]|nr:ParA family protein [Pseudomonadales bacterium]MCP5184128.1 ParA family protein [Pseudomonadales bacterium]
MADVPRRILVVNGKGGCGKTTVATNLAAMLARGFRSPDGRHSGPRQVSLIDHDPQASSSYWASQRSSELPPIHVIPAHQRTGMYQTQAFAFRIPFDTDDVIIDAHSNTRDRDLESLLKQSDIVLVPILASPIDIRAGGSFITELLTHRIFRAAPRPVGVIANRVQPNSETALKLQHFLQCLDVPNVATFRDTGAYHEGMERGCGICELPPSRTTRREYAEWRALVRWIDDQPLGNTRSSSGIRSMPLAANRRNEPGTSIRA